MIGIKQQVINITTENFERSIKKGLVLVDFWADWCAPCRIQSPVLKDVAVEVDDKAIIAKMNVDDNRIIAAKYGISNIPTLLLFKDGKVVKRFTGVQPARVLVKEINSFI